MTDKIKSEDFIKAFGSGVSAKVENVPTKLEVSSPIVIDCKYYLPCGRCDKTNELCPMLENSCYSFYVPVNNNGIEPK